MTRSRLLTGVAASVAVAALAGCSGSSEPAAEAAPEAQAPILQPGAPGEPNTTISPDDTDAAPAQEPNTYDVDFVSMMIPHHDQALRMTDLVADRARDEQVVAISGRIHDAQRVEIAGMEQWLAQHGFESPEVPADDHHVQHMPGMLSAEDFAALEAAQGARFDRLFLQQMIAHHEGALQMADRVLDEGVDIPTRALAADVATSQSVEIDILRGMLGAQPGRR